MMYVAAVSPLSSDEAHHSDRYQVRLQTSERERVCHICRLTDCAVLALHTQTAETLSRCVGGTMSLKVGVLSEMLHCEL